MPMNGCKLPRVECKLNQCDWAQSQAHAKARLTEGRKQSWLDFEFRATHERRPHRRNS